MNQVHRILQDELTKRCERNPRYTLRSFARDLKMSPGVLSEVLKGKRGISLRTANQISQSIGFSRTEAERFCYLVESEFSRSPYRRLQATERLKNDDKYEELQRNMVEIISCWHHFAIIECFKLSEFKNDAHWISQRLDITLDEVLLALKRLESVGVLSINEDGSIHLLKENLSVSSPVPQPAIQKLHKQLLGKAEYSVSFTPVEKRDFSSMMIAANARDIDWVRDRIRDFRRMVDAELTKRSNTKDTLYNLSVQFFPLTR